MQYTPENTLRLGKRVNNLKRTYLLINPLQAKHLAVSPTSALDMMACLGQQVAEKYPQARLVIGFAETATAIGAAVAAQFGDDCIYIHTTREEALQAQSWVCFNEEHSHAVEQKLCGDRLGAWIHNSPQIVLVDDELSTGKTLINIVSQLAKQFPEIREREIIAASIINRVSPANEQRLLANGIRCEYLVKLPDDDLTNAVARFDISAATPAGSACREDYHTVPVPTPCGDPRLGLPIGVYINQCRAAAAGLLEALTDRIPENGRILVLGTEEYMYPALILGKAMEEAGIAASVKCHATTRSPIGICTDTDYPIRCGYQLRSFYEEARVTHIYNLDQYDCVIVMTDAAQPAHGMADLTWALQRHGCHNIILAEGGSHVQHI